VASPCRKCGQNLYKAIFYNSYEKEMIMSIAENSILKPSAGSLLCAISLSMSQWVGEIPQGYIKLRADRAFPAGNEMHRGLDVTTSPPATGCLRTERGLPAATSARFPGKEAGPAGLTAKHDVLGDRQMRDQVDLLVDGTDAFGFRLDGGTR